MHLDLLRESKTLAKESSEIYKYLEQWLPTKGHWTICWRATRDGWSSLTFHARCDGKAPTLTIVEVVKNSRRLIFGGYATKQWDEVPGSTSAAPGSFVYSLRNNDDLPPFKSPLKDEAAVNAMCRHNSWGPSFGCGSTDIYITNNANLGGSHSFLGNAYVLHFGQTNTLLAGSNGFTPSEVEVLYLT